MRVRFSSFLLFIFGAFVITQSCSAQPAPVHQKHNLSAILARAAVSRDRYTNLIAQTYDYRFGSHRPFLPGNATTQDGRFLPPGSFPTAAYCGACHQAAYREWSESAHRSSFRAPFYKKNVDILVEGKGIEFSRHCESCHDPIALFSGALTNGSSVNRSFDDDGITCSVCHSITKLQPSYGVGSYVMGAPAVIVDKNGRPIPGTVPYEEILLHPDRHSQAVMRGIYKSPEFCGSCHEASLPRSLDGYKWLRAISTYDEWRKSAYSHRSPLPFYQADYKSCQECHMPRQRIQLADLGAKNGLLASHRWLGGNTAIPLYYTFQDQLSATEAFLAKQRVAIDIFGLKVPQSSALIAPLGQTRFSIAPGIKLQAMVVIRNRGLGHSLIPEQRDFYQAWAEFTVSDKMGRELFHSGYLQPNGKLDPHAYSFTNRLIDKNGNLLTHHEVWARRAIAWDKTISSGQAVIVRYEFLIRNRKKDI